ncbi:MAG TPA: potassium channel family protein [Planococcus sp. (in: firmicutes)]|nr:potassium channel family protein [Planococcus sp. (in: firmicutes)]
MESLYLVLGLIILVIGIIDFMWTTLWVDGGAGPITKNVSKLFWKTLKKISQRNHGFLSLSGPLLLSLTLFIWISMIWLGWTLIFAGSADAIINSEGEGPLAWSERFYYTGFLIFTLGVGDYYPLNGIWQIVSIFASGTGLLFITLGVTYILNVLEAVTNKRAFADSITGLADCGSELAINAWNGKDYHDFDLLLDSLSSQLSILTAQHKAYPVLHYYYAQSQDEDLPSALAIFDEALTLIHLSSPENVKPNKLLLKEARSSVESYLDTLTAAFIMPAEEVPEIATLQKLNAADVPTVAEEAFQKGLHELDERRKKLLALIEENGHDWPAEK